jgi:hypothetical protein
MTTFSGLVVAYFVVLVLLSRWRSAAVPSRAVQLLRALFPSWRFFEDVGDVLLLELRFGPSDEALGPWQPALPCPRRRLAMLLVGSDVNFGLACGSLLQQLGAELGELDPAHPERLTATAPYQLVHDLVRFCLRRRGVAPGSRYQWRLAATPPGGAAEALIVTAIDGLAAAA